MVIDEQTISKAVALLLAAAPRGSRVILFGSQARGEAGPHSDLDFLVIEPKVESEYQEMVRLAELVRPLRVPVDVVVVSAETFQYWADTPNTIFHRAARDGRAYEQVA